jgi:hypothetical protein
MLPTPLFVSSVFGVAAANCMACSEVYSYELFTNIASTMTSFYEYIVIDINILANSKLQLVSQAFV